MDTLDVEDVLGDSIGLFGDEEHNDGTVYYGPLTLTTAPKEGKANTLLADHLFSPSLLLAERIERGLIPLAGRSVVELGAGCALPSLLSATLDAPPALVVAADYPDRVILDSLIKNIDSNRPHFSKKCDVRWISYEWGSDVAPLLELVSDDRKGYDIVLLSDLLHFDASHDALLLSLTSLLHKSSSARTYVSAGKYTPAAVYEYFLREGEKLGLAWEEGEDDGVWRATLDVHGGGLDREQLGIRKGMCRWWTGRWSEEGLAVSGREDHLSKVRFADKTWAGR
ncbi:uncharacterized protein PHACADRAFT_206824 [Phanerochaete carnosa HHB-10118-sp]|uniref:Uncharacterized protein n=1 Tax=Phanerochaete carnosa (strain HHB-10118-sp) TaxID=650164 RepID=K5WFA6_PHACS|nr:uncharacterized protein PHACADRAFT_206824 [Phanerochaete carnosa HHB-10118-sp]EKM57975.1 hypothetical protein PHACADRAFT_206824 [Phanerochaete carnosa HHB-10118-sp]